MKILLLTSFLDCGGAETHIALLAESLARRGHKVCIASSGGRVADMLLGKGREMGIEHIRLPLGSRLPISLAYSKRRLDSLIKNGGFDIIHAHSRIPAFLACGIAKKYRVPYRELAALNELPESSINAPDEKASIEGVRLLLIP
jgi:hypothetical protein